MNQVSKEIVLDALRNVHDSQQNKDVVSLGMVSGVQVSAAGEVIVMIEVDPSRGPELEPLRQQAEKAVSALNGVKKVTAVLTAQAPSGHADQQAMTGAARGQADPHGMNKNPRLRLPVKKIIAVASGKGGVGKSTVTANLAASLAAQGYSVGILDADIYGPSQPRMMGLSGQKPGGDDGKIEPLEAHGVKVMSIGFMVDDEAPLVWRGPMVQSALYQLMRDVEWGSEADPLDIMLVDMPPGTGDAQLTMAQKVRLDGAIIVSTPQDIALLDARKAVQMFWKVGVQVLGVIENMSTYVCSNCGHEDHIFGHGGARNEAEKIGCTFLGEVPLNVEIRRTSDSGTPVSIGEQDSPAMQAFSSIAQEVSKNLSL